MYTKLEDKFSASRYVRVLYSKLNASVVWKFKIKKENFAKNADSEFAVEISS